MLARLAIEGVDVSPVRLREEEFVTAADPEQPLIFVERSYWFYSTDFLI